MFKKILAYAGILIGSLNTYAGQAPLKKVYISKVADHPALDKTVEGILKALSDNGFNQYETLDFKIESCQANTAIASQIASKYVNQKADVVVGVGTIAAQSYMRYAIKGETKLVFSSVTDPYKAELLKEGESSSKNVTGISNFIPIKEQILFIQKILPSLKTLGILYNEGEANSVVLVERLEKECADLGILLIKQTVSKTSEVPQAAVKLSNQVDAVFITNDSTALSSFQCIVKAALDKKDTKGNNTPIPVFVSDTDIVKEGALAALGPNQFDIGYQTGGLIAKILKGEDISTLCMQYPKKTELYLNQEMAEKIGISFPNDLLEQASVVLKTS
ncbi:MAG TPA: ABC transporter substrate-binding protein [Alphaproteobacteria bacterium]|nr:ABC transporter substrate-binding protein [Alphaproteobacteria bacterium]